MANILNGNSWYIDTAHSAATDDLALKQLIVTSIIITATSANAILKLSDAVTTNIKCDLRLASSGDSKQFYFAEGPLVFPNGIRVSTLTNCVAVIIGTKSSG